MGHLGQLAGGLEHVEQKTIPIPLSGGRAGDVMGTNLLAMIGSTKARIIAPGITQEAFDQVVGVLLKEWQEYKTTYQFHAAYGQRESHKTLFSAAGHHLAKHELYLRSSQLPNMQTVRQLSESYA